MFEYFGDLTWEEKLKVFGVCYQKLIVSQNYDLDVQDYTYELVCRSVSEEIRGSYEKG